MYARKGWSTAEYSTFYVLWGILGFFDLWLAGWLTDRVGRRITFIGLLLDGGSLAWRGVSATFGWQFHLHVAGLMAAVIAAAMVTATFFPNEDEPGFVPMGGHLLAISAGLYLSVKWAMAAPGRWPGGLLSVRPGLHALENDRLASVQGGIQASYPPQRVTESHMASG